MERSLQDLIEPNETAQTLFARCKKPGNLRTGIDFIDARCKHLSAECQDVIQVRGESSTGKTQIVLHALATCVLPENLGGQGSRAVLFDLDMKFQVERFYEILLARITLDFKERGEGDESVTQEAYQDVLKDCCHRVFVYRCLSNLDFLTALHALPSLVDSKDIRLVVIETLATFYWETAETDAAASGLHVSIPQAVKGLLRTSRLTVLAVKPVLFQGKWHKDSDRMDYTSATWNSLVSTKVELEKTSASGSFLAKTTLSNYSGASNFSIQDTGIVCCKT